jgi:prevent-host-death family protein
MKTISVAELRQNPTHALDDVEAGESYLVTRHRRPIARLVPVEVEAVVIIPPRRTVPTKLAARAPRHTYEETEALLAELASEW